MPDPSFPGPSRSNSSASTASSSGTSLSRRSRISRKRSRTITASSHRDDKVPEVVDQVLDISAANNLVSSTGLVPSPPATPKATSPTLPRHGTDSALGSIRSELGTDRSCTTFGTFGPPIDGHEASPGDSVHLHPSRSQPGLALSSETVVSPPTTKGKGRHPPRLTSPPSSFKPAATDGDRTRSSLRDSLMTQQSSTSSSVYPMSTAMDTESPTSPLSPVNRGVPLPAFELEVPRVQTFDADDVSYRLQLLVKNNYFLPPAHSKPSPADFPSPLNTKKAPSPTFLDLFRGKPKSKPGSPDIGNGPTPIFRMASDFTTASGQVTRDNGRPLPQTFRLPPGGQHMTRVVVVREKMLDLIAAAKQAEMDLGMQDLLLDRDRLSRKAKFTTFDGIVDPTDSVDVPPPSSNYPLALQASALHGLGIEDSLGAAILAERLPPPDSPGQSTLDPREDAWRRALLREAVGHSLNNSRATSSASRYSTPTKSPFRAQSSESLRPEPVVEQKRLLDRKILVHPIIDPSEDFPQPPTASSALNQSALVAVVLDPDLRRLSNLALLRAETPVPHTPLSPPPRRPFNKTQFSQSQTNISPSADHAGCRTPRKVLRKSMSSPMLSEKHGSRTNGTVTPSKSPPPMPNLSVSPAPSSVDNRMSAMTSTSRYTSSDHDDHVADDRVGRLSLATLASTDGRPSISEYSQPSPTASAFRDRWSDGYYSANSGGPEERATFSGHSPVLHQHPRPSTMSPPPRPSSSIAGIALSPPPRMRHLPFQPAPSRILAISPTRSSSQSTVHSFVSNSTLSQSLHAHPSHFFNASSQSFHSALHSAPPPSSTTEFFDHIQASMDDLDDSDESASETDQDIDITAVYAPSPGRPKLMRLGNLSTPNVVYPGAKEPYYPSVIPMERRRPVGHTASKAPYFTDLKGVPESLTHLSLAQHSREHLPIAPPVLGTRPTTAGSENVRQWRKDQEVFEESSRRLDGLLIRHMQAEKDTLKRIAETAKVSKS